MDDWLFEELDATHERGAFCCGKAPLDKFLQQYASQNTRTGLSRTFVATRPGEKRVMGYYAICTGSLEGEKLPEELRKRLPRYNLPTIHLGRLAVDQTAKGQGLGRMLLFHFLKKSLDISKAIGVYGVDTLAKDDEARSFYVKYGFFNLHDNERHLFLLMTTIKKMFTQAEGAASAPPAK